MNYGHPAAFLDQYALLIRTALDQHLVWTWVFFRLV